MRKVVYLPISELAEKFFKEIFYSGKVRILEENPSRFIRFVLPNEEEYLIEFHNLEDIKEVISFTYLDKDTLLPEFSKDWAELVVDKRSGEIDLYKSSSPSENSKFLLEAFLSWLESEGIYFREEGRNEY